MNRISAMIVFGILLVSGCIFYGDFFVDDAYITLRYAVNLVHGFGLRFNPQEALPVEGYTNFAWLLLQSPFVYFTSSESCIFWVLGAFSVVLTFVLLNRCCCVEDWSISPAVCILAAFHSFWFWNLSGMETGFLGLVILLWNLSFLKFVSSKSRGWEPAVLSLLAVMTRPDAGLVLISHFVVILWLRKGSLFRSLLGKVLLLAIPYGVFKLWYFGALLPNTFYAKSGLSLVSLQRGAWYLLGLLQFPELVILLLGYLFVMTKWRPASCDRRIIPGDTRETPTEETGEILTEGTGDILTEDRLIAVMLLIQALGYGMYIVRVGGDYFPFYRFVFPLIPWFLFGLVRFFSQVRKSSLPYLVSAFFVGFFLSTGTDGFVYSLSFRTDNQLSIVAAKALATRYPEGTRAVTAASGVVNYYCRFYSTDLYGLTDPHIARGKMKEATLSMAGHDKYDLDYTASLKADLVIPHLWIPGKVCHFDFRDDRRYLGDSSHTSSALRALLSADFLKKEYEQRTLSLKVGDMDYVYVYYKRRDSSKNKPPEGVGP